MNDVDYTVHKVVYEGSRSSSVQYRGRVKGESGWWILSPDFDSATDAIHWCKSKLKQ